MGTWNPWRGCHRYSTGCKYCYIHKGDYKRGIDTNLVTKTEKFYVPIEKTKNGAYKMKSGQTVFLCFSSDFLIEDADQWRAECWEMIRERSDLHFFFLTKRIERFLDCIPHDWKDGYENVAVGCTIENQENADYRLGIFSRLPCRYGSNVFPIMYILSFGSVGHILSKTEKVTRYLPVIYARKRERQISIIESLPFLYMDRGENLLYSISF